jgi:N-acyl-D-amino-acid deacylase
MKRIIFFLFILISLAVKSQDPIAIGCDILITNGKIIDGAGNSWYYGSIAVKDGKN